jgi:hypothetical protein
MYATGAPWKPRLHDTVHVWPTNSWAVHPSKPARRVRVHLLAGLLGRTAIGIPRPTMKLTPLLDEKTGKSRDPDGRLTVLITATAVCRAGDGTQTCMSCHT